MSPRRRRRWSHASAVAGPREQLGHTERELTLRRVAEPAAAQRGDELLGWRAGRRRCAAGSGRRPGRTASRRSSAPPCRSRRRGRCARGGCAARRRRAGRCDRRDGRRGRARRRTAAGRRGCAGRIRRSPRRRRRRRSGRRRMSAWTRGAPLWSARSIPKLRSIEVGRCPAAARSTHRSPVPLARSSTWLPAGNASDSTVIRRQRTSRRNVITRLTRS